MFTIQTRHLISRSSALSGLCVLLILISFSGTVTARTLIRGNEIAKRERLKPASSNAQTEFNQVLEWNQIFIDTLIATNTANSSSQRLGAIVHTAIFDA
jgi:hypothetical protein